MVILPELHKRSNRVLNFLAHQYLSFNQPEIRIGNFIADTIRGKDLPTNQGVLLGVNIHRQIDSFTDSHPVVLETRKLLYPYFSKYAGVVQDVYFDHFLAARWNAYAKTPLDEYCQMVYRVLKEGSAYMNQRAERTLYYMSAQDWLSNYRLVEGVDRALSGLSSRASFPNNMDKAVAPLEKHYDELDAAFQTFFPELCAAIEAEFGRNTLLST